MIEGVGVQLISKPDGGRNIRSNPLASYTQAYTTLICFFSLFFCYWPSSNKFRLVDGYYLFIHNPFCLVDGGVFIWDAFLQKGSIFGILNALYDTR